MAKYSLGLDIGTSSVGWALVDEDNECKIVRKGKKRLWGTRMFMESSDASKRRLYRSQRRRIRRRKERINLLRELMDSEISKVDPYFYERLDNSFFKIEDRSLNNKYILFNDKTLNDKEYFNEFPTIYHLRKYLVESNKKEDIRYIYLALHHMIKYRGNFLYTGEFDINNDMIVKEVFEEFNSKLKDYQAQYEDDEELFSTINLDNKEFYNNLNNILTGNLYKKDKKDQLLKLFEVPKKSFVNEVLIPLLVGTETNISKFSLVKDEKYEASKVDLISEDYESKFDNACSIVRELADLVDYVKSFKEVLNYYYLVKILSGNTNISDAMIEIYNTHEKDLKTLKRLFHTYLKDKYNEMFRSYGQSYYSDYVGMLNVSGKMKRFKHCSSDDFYNTVKGYLKKFKNVSLEDQAIIDDIKLRIEMGTYMPRQNSGQNGSIPMQLNLNEMKTILRKQSAFYPFLNDVSDGLTVSDKIISIFKFKIPYYVGPLTHANENENNYAWIIRQEGKENTKIYPWNIDKVVDKGETAKKFIARMQNKCTYLKNEYCLPKDSIIFSAYNCLSYINNIYVNGSKISVDQKQDLFINLFLKKSKVNRKDIVSFFNQEGKAKVSFREKDLEEVNCSMKAYIFFENLLDEVNIEYVDNIIRDICIFEDKDILRTRLAEIYGLDGNQIKKIINDCNYKLYGRLSNRFLNGITAKVNTITGEVSTILDEMWNTNLTLQEILVVDEELVESIDAENRSLNDSGECTVEEFINENLYVNPNMKRALLQSAKIIEEIKKIIGHDIDKYYIECTRSNTNEKKRSNSRYEKVKEILNNAKELVKSGYITKERLLELNEELEDKKDSLKSDEIYFYFTQLGKDMYTLENIDIEHFKTKYDIDHIYPQSLVKDDSLSNRVFASKSFNNDVKKNRFIYEVKDRMPKNIDLFYKLLVDNKLISKEKYRRLTEKEVTNEKLSTFANRQLVSTNQSVKGLIELLRLYYKVDNSNIIFSKAEVVSDFRRDEDLPKSRTANNYHHAHDAYLNVIVGKVVHDYYVRHHFIGLNNDYLGIQNNNYTLNPSRILEKDRNWPFDRKMMIEEIKKNLYERCDVLETTRAFVSNELTHQVTIIPAGSGEPVSEKDARADVSKYGGFKQLSYSKYAIVRYQEKGEDVYKLEAIPTKFLSKDRMDIYLKSIGYIDYEIVLDNLKINSVIIENGKKFCVTGKSGMSYVVKNLTDRYYEKNIISIIKKIEKYNKNIVNKESMIILDDRVIVAVAKNKDCKEIVLTKEEVNKAYVAIREKLTRKEFSYSSVIGAISNFPSNINSLEIVDAIKIVTEILRICSTNKREQSDLTLFGLSKNSCVLFHSKKLSKGTKIIAESITGYYNKVLFEVK